MRRRHHAVAGEHAGAVDVLGEGRDVVVGGTADDLLRGADLHEAPRLHDGDVVAEDEGFVRSWVMKMMVFFSSRWSWTSSACMSRRNSGSSAEKGSSSTRISSKEGRLGQEW